MISVNGGILVDATELEASGIAYACVPFSCNAPPLSGDLEICMEALPRAFAFVQGHIVAGRAVMVHCTSGKDRTGLPMSYYLMRTMGLNVDDAIAEVRRVRPIALSAVGWDEFGRDILGRRFSGTDEGRVSAGGRDRFT